MVKEIAGDYIRRRMEELCYGSDYYIRFRHVVLQPSEHRDISAYNEYYLLIEAVDNVNILSDIGLFDLSFDKADELQYEHSGLIAIHNYSSSTTHVRFIQAIPKLKAKEQHGCNTK